MGIAKNRPGDGTLIIINPKEIGPPLSSRGFFIGQILRRKQRQGLKGYHAFSRKMESARTHHRKTGHMRALFAL
jgi:hypothetical protein